MSLEKKKKSENKIYNILYFAERAVLSLLGLGLILAILTVVMYPTYHKYNFIKECMEENQTKEYCQQVYDEVDAID